MSDNHTLANSQDWLHPRRAAFRVMQELGISFPEAVDSLVRRLITKKIVSLYGEYVGPACKENGFFPEYQTFPIWCGVWTSDALRLPTSSIWQTGDLEALVNNDRFFLLNIRLSRTDVETMLRECANGDVFIDQPTEPTPSMVPVTAVEPKWNWEEALATLVALANEPDGLQAIAGFDSPNKRGALTSIENWLLSYFSDNSPQRNSPSPSEARRRAKYVIAALQVRHRA